MLENSSKICTDLIKSLLRTGGNLLIAVSLCTLAEIPSGTEAFLMPKFSKTPAQNSKALDDLWLDPVHKNFFPQMTEVKQ